MRNKHKKHHNQKPVPLTEEDRKAVQAANESGLMCLVNRDTKSDPLYTFYDRKTGQVLSESWREDWIQAINRAIQRKFKRSRQTV